LIFDKEYAAFVIIDTTVKYDNQACDRVAYDKIALTEKYSANLYPPTSLRALYGLLGNSLHDVEMTLMG
jgi:hypothetical protein